MRSRSPARSRSRGRTYRSPSPTRQRRYRSPSPARGRAKSLARGRGYKSPLRADKSPILRERGRGGGGRSPSPVRERRYKSPVRGNKSPSPIRGRRSPPSYQHRRPHSRSRSPVRYTERRELNVEEKRGRSRERYHVRRDYSVSSGFSSQSRSQSRSRNRSLSRKVKERSLSPKRPGTKERSPSSSTYSSRSRSRSRSLKTERPRRSPSSSSFSRSRSRSPNPKAATLESAETIKDSQAVQKPIVLAEHLSRNVTEAHVMEIFSRWGEICGVVMPLNSLTGYCRGFAQIEYKEMDQAVEAIRCMDGGQLDGNIVRLSLFKPLPPANPGKDAVKSDIRIPSRSEHTRRAPSRSSHPSQPYRSRQRSPSRHY